MTTQKFQPPTMKVTGDVFTFRWPTVEVTLDRFAERRDDLTAEITIYSHDPATKGLLYQARYNLMAGTTRKSVANMLAERMDFDWYAALQAISTLAVDRWREGEPSVDLLDVNPSPTRWLLHPYIEVGSPTILFALGDKGKSLTALAMAYTVAAGLNRFVGKTDGVARPVLFLDWEVDADAHHKRLVALMARNPVANRPIIHYKRMSARLADSAPSIRKEIAKTGAELVVIDSLGFAGGAAPEEAATAIGLFNAIRTFGVASLCTHHRRKAGNSAGSDPESLFGSAYYFNSARHVWQLQGKRDEGDNSLALGLIHVKANNGMLHKRHAYTVQFENDEQESPVGIAYQYWDSMASVPELNESASLHDRIMEELKHGALTVDELSEAIPDKQRGSIKVRLSKMKKGGQVISIPDNRWALPTLRQAGGMV